MARYVHRAWRMPERSGHRARTTRDMINKICNTALDAVRDVADGATSAIGGGTLLDEKKEPRRIEERDFVLEYPIHVDFSLVNAKCADRWGNLIYNKTARNFAPVMAMAAKTTVAAVAQVCELGELDPET